MTIATVIIISLLSIIAAAAVLIAIKSLRVGADYDKRVAREYAELRADMDSKSEAAAAGASHE